MNVLTPLSEVCPSLAAFICALLTGLVAFLVYLDPVSNGCLGWPASVLTDGPPDIESITHALKTGPYGQCVYESENDVADHQVRLDCRNLALSWIYEVVLTPLALQIRL